MFAALIEKLVRHEDLTSDEAAAAMTEVMEGRAAPAALAGLLATLVMKGERPAEIAGLARRVRKYFGDEERLRKEALNLARPAHRTLVVL
jgi:anthranilate phosphoribosyltransferase